MKSRVEIAEVGKSRRETEQVNLVDGGCVKLANLLNRQAIVLCHSFKVLAIVDHRDFFHRGVAAFRGHSAAKLSDQLWNTQPRIGHGSPIEFEQDAGERGNKLDKPFGRMALQFRGNSTASQKRFISYLIREIENSALGPYGSIYD
jgi:hypothetical protein